jgi:hypothetical protein
MAKGLDCDSNCAGAVSCIVAHGYGWVARYIVPEKSQPLTRAEAEALSKAGLFIVSVWEKGNPTSAGYFNFARGLADGEEAFRAALAVGQPAGSPIYFCVDFDSTQPEIEGPIAAYFRGVRQGFGLEDGSGDPTRVYLPGVYGNGLACEWLESAGLVHFTWLAMPVDWGGADFSDWNLHQTGSATLCGLSVDTDESNVKGGGGWKLPSGG